MGEVMPSQYWKNQEYRVRDIFRKRGWVANRVPCSGSAEGFKGDVVATRADIQLVVDHKSTRGKDSITIKKKDLKDIDILAQKKMSEVNHIFFDTYPLLTFNYFQDRQVYVIVPLEELLRLYEK